MRGGYAWDYQRHLPHRALGSIPFLFESGNIAASLAAGHGFGSPFRVDTGPTAWMTPLYPVLLSWIMRIFGTYTFASWVAAVAMNGCFSTAACLPVYYAGKRLGGTVLAVLAGLLWAVFPNAILLSFQSLWDTSLSAFLGASVVWATLRLREARRSSTWVFYGLLWGAALMANAALLSLLPLCLGWAAWRTRRIPALIAAVTVMLCCVPWTVRNYEVFHAFVPLRSVLGLQLWVGNNPGAKAMWLGEQHPIHETAEREKYIQVGEIAYMKEKKDNALAYIFTHPAREAQLMGGRFVMFWSGGSEHPFDEFLHSKSAWFRYVLLFNLIASAASLAGIAMLFRARNPYAIPMAAGPIVFPCAYYMTLSLPRYRHPIDPVLMLLLAYSIWRIYTVSFGRRAAI
jgi:4-amino-4-deoxy-L-arabinose transferase-like glycosyltransferase